MIKHINNIVEYNDLGLGNRNYGLGNCNGR